MNLDGLSNYDNKTDLLYILGGILILETLMILVVRYYPGTFKMLNTWYNQFGWLAVGLDLVSMGIAFMLARWIVSTYFPQHINSIWVFVGALLAVQLIHDASFYQFVIRPIPRGHNRVMDLFKEYADVNGALILFGDALIVVLSLVFALVLKNGFPNSTIEISAVFLYALMYVMGQFGTSYTTRGA